MASQLSNEMLQKLTDELNKKKYILSINGDKKALQIILKTAFEKEIVNRVYEIKGIIVSINPNFINLDKKISVENINYNGQKHKAIMLKYN